MMKRFLFILLALCAFSATPAWGTTYYVSTSGSNANSCSTASGVSGQTAANAKRNIINGVGCLASGDTLNIHAGTYTDPGFATSSTDIINGTSWGTATTIQAYNGTVTWNMPAGGADAFIYFNNTDSYIIIKGTAAAPFIFDGTNGDVGQAFGFRVNGPSGHIKFDGIEVKNAILSGIYLDLNSTFNWITGCYIHNNGLTNSHGVYSEGNDNTIEHSNLSSNHRNGIQIYNGYAGGTANRNIFRYNYVALNGESGIAIDGSNNQIYENIIRANGAGGHAGISCGYSPGSDSNLIANNTIHANLPYGLQFGLFGNCTNLTLRNNSISSNTGECVRQESGTVSGTISYTNCSDNGANSITAASATISNTTTVTPGYINAASLDFGLIADGISTSALIDAGTSTSLSGIITCNGTCDIGAHETMKFASANVPSANTLIVNLLNQRNSPALPSGATCSGFSALKNGSPNAITACSRTDNNQFTLTTTNAYVGGNTAKVSYASGNVTDSALIGNTYKQALSNFTDQTVTNLISGSTPVLTQVSYKFQCYGGTEANPDCTKGLNTGITIPPNSCVSLRGQVSNTVANKGSAGYAPYISRNSGAYAALPDGPCSSTSACTPTGTGTLPPELMTGATTEQLAGSGTFVAGGVQLSVSGFPSVTLAAGQDTEFLVPICVGSGNSAGDTFDIRWYQSGSALDAYTQTPRITIGGYSSTTGKR